MNYYKNNIRNNRGDTYSSALIIEGLGGQELDNVYFTCRNNLNNDSEILFEKSIYHGITEVEYDEANDIRKYAIRIEPADTNDIQEGTYFYDLQIVINNDVFTIMKGEFIIEQDATRKTIPSVDPELYIKVALDEINGEVIGTTVTDKLEYLAETKGLIKEELNDIGAELTDEDTFRSYVTAIEDVGQDLSNIVNAVDEQSEVVV